MKNPKLVRNIVIAVVVLILLLVLGYFGYKHFFPKTETPAPAPVVETPAPEVINYNGTYTGATDVANGLANISVTVTDNKLKGTATYKGTYSGFKITLPAKINGTVSTTGSVAGTVTVTGTSYGYAVSLTGPTNGQITGNKLNCAYSVSGNAGSYSGEASLKKH